MDPNEIFTPALLDVLRALGVFGADNSLNTTWFSNPLTGLGGILSQPAQRAALFDLLDQLAPPAAIAGLATTSKWHPLLGNQPRGNIYLTVDTATTTARFGIAGRFTGESGAGASLNVDAPLFAISGSAVSVIAGTAAAPLTLALSVPLAWTIPAHSIALASIDLALTFAPEAATQTFGALVTLRGLDADGTGAKDAILDPSTLGAEGTRVLLGFIREKLHDIEATATGDAAAIATHLLPLLGLDGSTPPFPFASIAHDAGAIASWFRSLLTGSPAPVGAWLQHLAGLLGVDAPALTTGAGGSQSWSVALLAPSAGSAVSLTLESALAADNVTPLARLGINIGLVPSGSAPVRIDVDATLFELPLAGSSAPRAFTNVAAVVSAPADPSQPLIGATSGSAFSLDSIRAGVTWNGASIAPIVEMRNVAIAGIGSFPIVDLRNALTVAEAAASDALTAGIKAALAGTEAGQHLAALAGLVAPASDASAPLVDVAQLVTHPTRAIAAVHRAALLSTAHSWKNYFGELAALLSLSTITGSGTEADPWAATIVAAAPAALELVAWNAQITHTATATQQLRIGLRLAATGTPFTAALTIDLLGADLAADGTTTLSLVGAFTASVAIAPQISIDTAGFSLTAASLTANARMQFGSAPIVNAAITGLAVTTPSGTINVPAITYPFASSFDIANPSAALGIGADVLEKLVQALLVRALTANFGATGTAFAVLLGIGGIDGLPSESPSATGTLFTDPLGALHTWLGAVATGLSTDGDDFITPVIVWLAGVLASSPDQPFPSPDPYALVGSGEYDDPWRLALGATDSRAALQLWLEPAGIPGSPATVAANIADVDNPWTLAVSLQDTSAYLPAIPAGVDVDALGDAWQALSDFMLASDGVVPVASQIPTGGSWTTGTALTAAHSAQPSDPSACTQILAAADGWAAPGSNRAVLLLGPAFSDHNTWSALLARAESANSGSTSADANFDLRVPGVEPASIDLRPVAAVAEFYTADLQDDGSNDVAGLVAQIGLVVARIEEIKPDAAIVLVAHSTAGVAARTFAAANASTVKGLVTLGTPHAGAPLEPLTDPAIGDGLRVIAHLLPDGVAAGPLQDAIAHLLAALDGYRVASSDMLPVATPYPIADFAGNGSTDTGGVPALALGGQIGGTDGVDLVGELRAALSAKIAAATVAAPTHLGYGVRVDLPLGADATADTDDPNASSVVNAVADVRLDLGRLAIGTGATEPARPAQALTTIVSLVKPGGWLAGGPGAAVRVRSAELGVVVTQGTSALEAVPIGRLHEVSYYGKAADLVEWGAPLFEAGVGAAFQALSTPAPATGSTVAGVIAALRALGLVADDSSGSAGLASDAIHALTADPLALLGPRIKSSFAALTVPGFTAVDRNTCQLLLSPLPIALAVTLDPPAIVLRTSNAAAGLPIADSVEIAFSATMPLATMKPAITGALTLGPATVTYADGALTLALPPAILSLSLYPAPSLDEAKAAFTAAIPRIIIDTVASALLESALGPGYSVPSIIGLLENPGHYLVGANALGDGTKFDPAKLTDLIASLGVLPGGITLTATGTNPTTISLVTTAPLGGVVSIAAGVSIDATRHLTPSGTVTIQAPSSGSGAGPSLSFGVGASGISLAVATGGASSTTIHLLPTFDGGAALSGAAKKLLPAALDALVKAVAPNPATPPAIVTLSLEIASALDLYDSAGGFDAHETQLAAMVDGAWLASLSATARTQFLAAATKFFNDPSSPLNGALPGTFSTAGNALTWSYPLPVTVASGTLSLAAGWDAHGPTLAVHAANVALSGAPITTSFDGGFADGALVANVELGIDLSSSLGLPVAPQLTLSLAGSGVALSLLPLGAGTASTLAIQLAPPGAIVASGEAALALLTSWAIPLAADALLSATASTLATPLWTGGPTTAAALTSAGIITTVAGTPTKYSLATPLDFLAMPGKLLRALSGASVPIATTPPLALSFVDDTTNGIGVRLLGSVQLDQSGNTIYTMLFGSPATWLGASAGVTLYLFTVAGDSISFAPALSVRGLGLGISSATDTPILDEGGFRVGGVDAYLAFELALAHGALALSGFGAGVELDKVGIPLNSLDSGSSSNPVASSLLSSGGQQSSGDSAGANPTIDVIASYLDGALSIQLAEQSQKVVIPVHASLGPLYIDQLEIVLDNTPAVSIGVDGDLKISSLDVAVDELALRIPFKSLLDPSAWGLDLQGLAVAFDSGGINISGGLHKVTVPSVEYNGSLAVTMPSLSFSVIAGYGRPSDALGGYTSLFMFGAFGEPLGGPPFAFVTGLGGGFGYNRQLLIPTDFNKIPSFPLITAMDGASSGDDPLDAFAQMAIAIPPRRGAYWIAGGVRFTSFALVNTTAIVAIALDRGFVVDVLAVSRMALPTESFALASIELALKARYDSNDETLAVQAQLTDNSYLFSHDCQLTGGFAFFIWFREAQFVLTLGGYHPSFSKPAEFPDVPRLGFNWSVSSHIVIKGNAYFALTNSCVMAGGLLSLTGYWGPVKAWFDAPVDMLVSWDPFQYAFDIGIDIGASVTFKVCFFKCATVHLSLSKGASISIAGPPFHGSVTIDAYVTSITVSFGDDAQKVNYITDWSTFAGKYLTAGDSNGTAVSMQVTKGLLVPTTQGNQAEPGSQAQPWQVGLEFTFSTTTRMPANASIVPVTGLNALDVAPMDARNVQSTHLVTIEQLPSGGGAPVAIAIASDGNHWTILPRTGLFPEATWHWVDPEHLPAGARTIQAIAGLGIDAHVAPIDPSALLSMAALTTDLPANALPLPFASTTAATPLTAKLAKYGKAADAMAKSVAHASSAQTLAASATVLQGNGVFAAGRTAAGLSSRGLSALSARSLAKRRSAPPLITPLATGLTAKSVGLKAPAPVVTQPAVASVPLDTPRLRAVLGAPTQPVVNALPAPRTSVANIAAAARAPRTQPPVAQTLAGARLVTVAEPNAPRATSAAVRPRAIRNADFGASIGGSHQKALTLATKQVLAKGVTLGAGAMHLWDVPNDAGSFMLSGSASARVISMDRGGTVLSDVEVIAPVRAPIRVTPGAAIVAISCIGPAPSAVPAGVVAPIAAGAVTMRYARPGASVAVGWQSSSTLAQIGASSFAARGSTLRLLRPAANVRNSQRSSFGAVRASDAVGGQLAVETRLPSSVQVLIIALDAIVANAQKTDDLRIAVNGARLGAASTVTIDARRLLIYDVTVTDSNADHFTVAVASVSAWSIEAVVGVKGTSADWAANLAAGIPTGFVADGPLAPGGALTVTYVPGVTA